MKIAALYVYPVKACAGISVSSAEVVERGFLHDRRWMLVDESGVFVTQRTIPKLALVSTAIGEHGYALRAPDTSPLLLPFDGSDGPEMEVQVWSHRGSARRHAEASAWFSDYLRMPVSAVYMPDDHRRPVNPERGRPGDVVSFADAYPFLAISEESLADLNSRLSAPLDMRRFRPNIVVSGGPAYGEDHWSRIRAGSVSFRAVKRCDRCAVTTVDPDTGEKGKEPLATLSKYRQMDGKVWFGMNLIHDGPGKIRVGDPVATLD